MTSRTRWWVFAAAVAAGTAGAVPSPPVFSPGAGCYPEAGEAIEVAISAEAGTTVYYTTDGSRPVCTNSAGELLWSPTARVYGGPVAAANGRDDGEGAISRIMTGAHENDAYDPWYAPADPPRTIPVLRAAAVDAEGRVSEVATASYLLGDTAERYGATPVWSVCAEWADWFDNENGPGIYRYPTAAAKKKVANAHAEYFEGGRRAFAKWAELRVQGTTTVKRPKKSLRLTGWKGYNPTKGKKEAFDWPFFAGKANRKYASVVLRMGGNDWNRAILRDRLAQAINRGGKVDGEDGAVCVVFLNGVYWGVHETRERFDPGFFQHQRGISDSDGFSLLEYADEKPFPQVNEGRGEDDEERTSGAYADFWGILRQMEAWGDDLRDAERWAWFTNRVEPDSLMQHFGAELFAGNSDWPQNNQRWWRAWPEEAPGAVDRSFPRNDGRWNWTFHDLDFAFALPFDYVPDWADGLGAAHDPHPGIFAGEGPYCGTFTEDAARPFHAAMSQPAFRNRYLNHVFLKLATAWSAAATTAELERIADGFREAGMDENGARWRQPQTAAEHERRLGDIRDYLKARPEAFAWHTRRRYGLGALRPVDIDTGGEGKGTVRVAGYALGNEDELPGGALPVRAAFPEDVPLTLEAEAAKGSVFEGWYVAEAGGGEEASAVAEDCAANYAGDFPSASRGTGWGEWVVETSGAEGAARALTETSGMPIHGRSRNGMSFGLRAADGGYVNVRRELAGGRVLAVGETMSVDVGFGIAGGNGGAGVAFVTAGGASKPVQLILSEGGGEGTAFRVYLAGKAYVAENFPPIPGMPIRVALTREGETAYALRLTRGEETFAAEVVLAGEITGIRLYKNPYGAGEAKYDLLFDRLRVAEEGGGGGETSALETAAVRETAFFETGKQAGNWMPVVDGIGGSWVASEPLCNIGSPAFGLWSAGGGRSALRRWFGSPLTNGWELSFAFQNNAFGEDGAAAGVRLLAADGVSFELWGEKGAATYRLRAGEDGEEVDTGVDIVSTGIGVTVAPDGDGGVAVEVEGRRFTVAAGAAIEGIEFYNRGCGAGTERNVYFNRVWVRRAAADGERAARAGGATRQAANRRAGAWRLAGTERELTILPADITAVTAVFGKGEKSDLEIWAEERGIDDPWAVDGETGRTWAETYLLETNGVASLHGTEGEGYALRFTPGEHGVGADIEVSDDLAAGEAGWREPEEGELRPVEKGRWVFGVEPSNRKGRLFIRLKLKPLE